MIRFVTRYLPLALMTLTLAACGDEPAAPPPPGPAAVSVVTLQAEPITLERQLPGRTNALLVAEVRPQVTGIVEKRLFEEGAQVKAGEPLYRLEDSTYRADVASAEAAVARAEAAHEQAQLRARRAEELIETNAISRQDYDDALSAARVAAAEVGVARAALQRARVLLGYTRITAPIDGFIGKSTVTQGALVTANQEQALATVRTLDPIYVDLNQSSSELLQLRRALAEGGARTADGLPVTILLEDGSRYSHEGKLAFRDVAVDPTTGSFDLRVVVPNPDGLLMPGMYVRAAVSNAVLERALLVPQRGIARDPRGNASAMVVASDGTAELRAVQVSRTVGDRWLVTGGLVEGDRVIVEGLQRVQPGLPLDVTEIEPERLAHN